MANVGRLRAVVKNGLVIVCALAFLVICGLPYLRWWDHPSLFDDDFLRVDSLRRTSLGAALFRPFNEHMTPLFELMSWLAWVGSGRRVESIPLGFQTAAFLATGTTLALFATWIARETRSTSATLLGVALLALSRVSAETVLWYSACSFQWAAAASIAACLAASIGADPSTIRHRRAWLATSALGALAAPAFSAVGILAGPMASLRILAAPDPGVTRVRGLARAMIPLVGTLAYFIVCERFQYRELVSASVRRGFNPAATGWATARAPSAVLLPGLFGWTNVSAWGSPGVQAGLSSIGLVGAFLWAVRGRQRPLVLVGMAFLLGGYISTYATRARPNDPWIFAIQRYHLFPMIGLVTLIAGVSAPWLRRLDRGPARGWLAGTCLAGLLAIPQYPAMKAAADRAYRFPNQPRALAASMRLEQILDREGIMLSEVMGALEPTRMPWFSRPWPFNPLLHLVGPGPALAKISGPLVRPTLLREISAEDREALFGGMEATRHGFPPSAWPSVREPYDARAAGKGPGGTGRQVGSKLEFAVGPELDDARAIALVGFRSAQILEVEWTGNQDDWSLFRSVRWDATRDQAVTFEMIPHWSVGTVRRLRISSPSASPIAPGVVRFLR